MRLPCSWPQSVPGGVKTKAGWAFGIGLERLAMKLYSIPDIRLFWSDDPGFLVQFSVADCHTPITYKVITSDTALHRHNPSLSQPSIVTTLHRHNFLPSQPSLSWLSAIRTYHSHSSPSQSQLSVTVINLCHCHNSLSLSQIYVTVTILCCWECPS